MDTKSLWNVTVLLTSSLILGASGSVHAAGGAEKKAYEAKPDAMISPLEDFLFQPEERQPAERTTIARFGAPPVLPFLTLSHLFPGLLIGAEGPSDDDIVGQPWTGAIGITRTVADIMAEQAAIDRAGQALPVPEEIEHEYPVFNPQPDADTVFSANWPPSPTVLLGTDAKRGRQNPQTVGPVNFRATRISDGPGYVPPDTEAAIGTTQIVVIVNGKIITYNRNGTANGALNASADTFFGSVRNGSSTSDPKVRFDRLSQRWFISIINVASASNRVMLAVSSGPVITNTSSFTFYQFTFDQPTPTTTADTGGFADYPTLGVDANAAYIGVNVFKSNYVGSTLFVIRKSSVTTGGPIVVTPFRELGLFTPQGADNDTPTATNGYVIAPNTGTSGRLNFRRVLTPGGVPTLTATASITVPATASPTSAPAQGSSSNLDGLDLRMFAAQVHRNVLTGATTLWTAHTNNVNASGISSGGSRDGSRWYEIQNLDATPTLKQSGTLFDPAASNPLFFLCGTVAMSGQGSMALGATASGVTSPTKVAVAGRLITDPTGATQAQTFAATTTGSYNGAGNPGRWGDYSYTMVDPLDDMTFWTAQMYADSSNGWAVQVVQLKSPPPPTINSVSPAALPAGTTTNVTVTGTSSGGAAFFNPLPEYTNHLTAATTAPGVTLSNVAIVIPASPTTTPVTQVTLDVTVPANTAPGNYNLTLTNPDGQSVTATGILVINVPTPTLTSLNPASAEAGSGDFTLTVNGSNFASNSVVNFNGVAKPTTFVNSGQLTAAISSADITTVGTYPVTVSTPSGSGSVTSTPLNFAVNTVSVAGTITLEGLSTVPVLDQAIRVDFRAPGTTNVLFTRATLIGVSSAFNFTGVTPGVYDIAFKGVKYLRRVVKNVDVSQTSTGSVAVTLSTGDSDDDNEVGIIDFGVFVNSYGSQYDPNDANNGYDAAADLDDDGSIDVVDLGLLVNNYSAQGEP